MKKILVPTDFSLQADNALDVAVQLAKKNQCELHLLHVLELPLHKVDALSTYNDLPEAVFFMKLARKKFDTLRSKSDLNGIEVYEHVEFHDIFKGVFQVCKKQHIDLVVMGSNGVSGLREMLIGSNTEKVVRTSETPVLVIKNKHDSFQIKDFVFASDFKEESKKPFEKALHFAKLFKAKMHLLMVNTPTKFLSTEEANTRIQDFISMRKALDYEVHIYNDATIEKGIMHFSASINADLIAMSTHGRQGISHFFNGSVSEDLVNHAKRPVMTFKI
ncbi:universal stress protein [Changchengzhania lutea]|uniref:universal stress protein n=1 Tax=Changchengzhania lutea TaxID=2049305 RepID=UPI00115E5F67|nr:universal stress protein [Changchengzhania lutea]